jgi:outer membrane protein insertion porin family
VSEDKDRVHVVFVINEGLRYRVRNIETSGNSVLSREQLLTTLKLRPNDPFNSRFLSADTQAMKDQYDNLGRPFANVQPVPRFLEEPGWLDLVYDINEDQVMRIGRINIRIRGDETHTQTAAIRNRINRYLKPGEIARAKDIQAAQAILRGDPIVDKEEPPSFNIRRVEGDDYFSPTHVARGQSTLVSFMDQGRSPTIITTGLFKPAIDSDTLWTTPGVESWFSPLELQGTAQEIEPDTNARRELPPIELPSTRPLPAAKSMQTSYLSPVSRERRIDESQPSLALVPVEAASRDEVIDAQSGTFQPEIVFRAQSGDPFLFAQAGPGLRGQSIDPNGLPNPQNYLYGTSPQGDPFGTGLRGPLADPMPGFVDVDIDITEGRTGRLMFGAGVNSDAGLVGSLVLQEDNFDILRFPRSWQDITQGRAYRGGGQSFRIELVPGTQVSRYNVSWRDPYIFGTDFSFGVDAFFYNRFYDNWTEDRAGGRLSLGYIINRYWSLGAALRLENVEFRDFTNTALTPSLYTDVAGDTFLSTAQLKLAYDTRDSAFLPSKGHLIELAYEQAFGEFNYPRVDLTGSQYFTVYERPDGAGKHILEFRGDVAWTGGDTPVYERLFAGGFQSFRGFQFRGVTPRQNNFRIGGEFMALGTAEYIFPITAGDGLRGVVFSDFGTVDTDVSLDEFRVTAGFGFRVSVPAMGPAPIAFDFAFPILSEAQDDEQLFSFYMGTTW